MNHHLLILAAASLPLTAQEAGTQTPAPSPASTEQPPGTLNELIGTSETAGCLPRQATPAAPVPGTLPPEAAHLSVQAPTPPIVTGDTTPQIQPQAADQPLLPPAEQHVRKGIALLLKLHAIMADINSPQTAEKAIPHLLTISRELLQWTQGFASLPLLDEDTRMLYEDQYLPIFRKINTQLKLQGERLASAKYYGSRDLQTALAHLVLTLQ